MSNFSTSPMHSYKMKYVGIAIILIGTILQIVLHNSPNFSFYTIASIALGLFFIIFSKEKTESNEISIIRGQSMRTTLQVLLTVLIVFGSVSIYYNLEINGRHLLLLSVLSSIVYLLFFRIRIAVYNKSNSLPPDNTVNENIKNSKRSITLFAIIFIQILIISVLLWIL